MGIQHYTSRPGRADSSRGRDSGGVLAFVAVLDVAAVFTAALNLLLYPEMDMQYKHTVHTCIAYIHIRHTCST